MTDERGNDLAARDPGGPNRNGRTDEEQRRSSWWIALLPRKCWIETTELGRQEFVFWPRTIMVLYSIVLVSCKSWNLTMRVGLLSCITIGGALAGDHWTRLLRSGECVDEFRFQKEDTSGITFLVMQRSLAFSLGSGDPSVNRDQNQRRNGLLLAQLYRTLHLAYIARLVELNHN